MLPLTLLGGGSIYRTPLCAHYHNGNKCGGGCYDNGYHPSVTMTSHTFVGKWNTQPPTKTTNTKPTTTLTPWHLDAPLESIFHFWLSTLQGFVVTAMGRRTNTWKAGPLILCHGVKCGMNLMLIDLVGVCFTLPSPPPQKHTPNVWLGICFHFGIVVFTHKIIEVGWVLLGVVFCLWT